MKGKRSTFLKGMKSKNSNRSEARLRKRIISGQFNPMPNSTKIGQGQAFVYMAFDVDKKRSEQLHSVR